MKYYKNTLYKYLGLIILFFSFASYATINSTNFLVLSDIHLDKKKSTPMQVNPSGYNWANDLDQATFTIMLGKVQVAIQNGTMQRPSFILLLGDIAGYDRNDIDDIYNDENFVFQQLNNAFPNTPIFLTFGNNDSLEKDYGTFYYAPGINGVHSSYEIAKANGWADGFLSTGKNCLSGQLTYPCLLDEDKINGYFTAYIAPNMRLISLNSSVFAASKYNTALQEPADTQLAWLEQELRNATLMHDSVLITSHIPIGNNIYDDSLFWRSNDRDAFYTLLSRYKKNIIGILSGHTHLEELKVLQDNTHNNIGALIFTAGLSTSHGNAASIKSFYLSQNNQQWGISNYTTFYFKNDTTSFQNNLGDGTFSLHKLYDFDSYYCTNNQNISNIVACLVNVNVDKLHLYYTAGNPNYAGTIGYPADIFVTLPYEPELITQRDSKSSHTVLGIAGAAAVVGIGAIAIDKF